VEPAGVSRTFISGNPMRHDEKYLLEHRTDGTDAFDTLYIGCEKFPFHDTFSISVSGVS